MTPKELVNKTKNPDFSDLLVKTASALVEGARAAYIEEPTTQQDKERNATALLVGEKGISLFRLAIVTVSFAEEQVTTTHGWTVPLTDLRSIETRLTQKDGVFDTFEGKVVLDRKAGDFGPGIPLPLSGDSGLENDGVKRAREFVSAVVEQLLSPSKEHAQVTGDAG